jgi:hypothetical protein
VRVAREAPSVRDGQAVLALPGGLRWVAGHDPAAYDPPRQFADVLQPPLGNALRWRHTHQFAPAAARGTLVTDIVDTPVPARALRPMFGYRHRQLAADLAAHGRAREVCPQPLTIAVTGASGLIGTALAALLTTGGHRVIRLVRHAPGHDGEREWHPGAPDPELLNGVDAVIHLAGAPGEARNAGYTRALARVLHRPALISVPPAGPRLLLGTEGSRELAEASQRVRPAVLAAAGHPFRFAELEDALRHVLGRNPSPAWGPSPSPSSDSPPTPPIRDRGASE